MKIFIPTINDIDLIWREEENQIQRLSRWANIFGDFKVAYSFKDDKGIPHFSRHYSVLNCLETKWGMEILNVANHRQILPIELVLDLDNNPTIQQFNRICDELDKQKELFYGYFTGSKGYHIHIFSYDFIIKGNYIKNKFREYLLKNYNADLHKKSDKVMIAMENQPHWKTRNKKRLIRNGRFI